MEMALRELREVFSLEQIDEQNPILVYTQLSRFKISRTITATPIFSSLAHFLWQKVYEIDGICCYVLGGNSTS
jgi:hypothetical protein